MSGDFVCQDDFMTKILSDLLSMKNILNNIQADLFGVTVNGIITIERAYTCQNSRMLVFRKESPPKRDSTLSVERVTDMKGCLKGKGLMID